MSTNTAEAWYEEGNALVQLRRWPEAIDAFDQALRFAPRNPLLLCSRAWVLLVTGDHARALSDADEALAWQPTFEWAHRLRSMALFQAGNHTESMREAVAAVQLQPNGVEPLHNLFSMQRALGFLSDAWATAHCLIHAAPQDAQSHATLGVILLDYTQWADAEREFRRALELKPSSVEALNGLGVALNAQNKPYEAIEALCSALELEPSSIYVAANLTRARKRYFFLNGTFAVIGIVAALAFAGLAAALFNLNNDQQFLLIGSVIGVVLGITFLHRWVKARRLPPAAQGFVDPFSRVYRRRLIHVALIPITIFLLLLSLMSVVGLVFQPTAAAVVTSLVILFLTAWAAYGWRRTRATQPEVAAKDAA